MGIPVRLSDTLMDLAREAADADTRSLTAQVEHWALIGRAVERVLSHSDLAALKANPGNLAASIPDRARREAVAQAIVAAVRGVDREALRRRVLSGASAVYGVERRQPGIIKRYEPAASPSSLSAHGPRPRFAPARKRKHA